jgi:nucleotide-binding universal stress UspA family protein
MNDATGIRETSNAMRPARQHYRILVPLDGSRFAERALPTAYALARCANAELKLLHVLDFIHLVTGVESSDEVWLRTTARNDAERYLDSCGERLEKAAVPARCAVAEGEPAEKIREEAEHWGADLIVMATHGHGAFDRAWLGSVADALVRESATPVVLVRVAEQPSAALESRALRHVLIPLDGSALAEQAIEPAVRFTRCSNARLTLLRVVRPAPVMIESVAATLPPQINRALIEQEQRARDYLTRIADSLKSRVEQISADVVTGKLSDAAEIIAYAEQHDVDLIALATHARSGIKRVVLGSVADKLIRGSPVPVLVVRPHG